MSSVEDSKDHVDPTPDAIIALAKSLGYKERRERVSSTLFFTNSSDQNDGSAATTAENAAACDVLINVYYSTRSIMTLLTHPSNRGTNELWRSNAYNNLEDLEHFFVNPRQHTNKGYRKAIHAVRGCVGCGEMKTKGEFSKNQWRKGPDSNKCLACLGGDRTTVNGSSIPEEVVSLTNGLEHMKLESGLGEPKFPSLTEDVLQTHDQRSRSKNSNGGSANHNNTSNGYHALIRRQFNCPACPKQGRGPYSFFKKVPALKPICKCPRCKQITRGNCKRLYPVPQGDEKGYGLFKCTACKDGWGSSRAIANVGQQCYSCAKKGNENVFVTPFRLETIRRKKAAFRGRGMRRVPKEPIREGEVDERGYGDADRIRNDVGGGTGGTSGEVESFDYEPRRYKFDSDSSNDSISTVGSTEAITAGNRVPAGYKHKCTGCSSGRCRSRKVPLSQIHDSSDGNTLSTRASIVTNSSIDKTDFVDRDEDFSGFED